MRPRRSRFGRIDRWLIGVILVQAMVLCRRLLQPVAPEPAAVLAEDGAAKYRVGNVLGANDARTTLVLFNDYQCPACRDLDARLDTLLHEGLVRVYYRHFPLSSHPHAKTAAIAAECAGRQGAFREIPQATFRTAGLSHASPMG